jgi:hypothetical protein
LCVFRAAWGSGALAVTTWHLRSTFIADASADITRPVNIVSSSDAVLVLWYWYWHHWHWYWYWQLVPTADYPQVLPQNDGAMGDERQ